MKQISQKLGILAIAIGFITSTSAAYAACSNPAGTEGNQVYNTTHKVMQFCDGTDWVSMSGGGVSSDTLTGLSCASGEVAKWNGTAWACAADAAGSGGDDLGNHTATQDISGPNRLLMDVDLATGVYDDGTSNAPYSQIHADSFHTNGIGVGQMWIEGWAIDANNTIKIGTGAAGGQTAQDVEFGGSITAQNVSASSATGNTISGTSTNNSGYAGYFLNTGTSGHGLKALIDGSSGNALEVIAKNGAGKGIAVVTQGGTGMSISSPGAVGISLDSGGQTAISIASNGGNNISMGGNNRIINLADPIAAQDAATKAYVDANGGDDLGNHIATTTLRSDTNNTDDLGTTAIRWKDGWFAGNVTATAYFHSSDERLKDNIETISGLDLISQMRGVTYDWKKDGSPSAGVIAQEVEKVFPRAVQTDTEGMKSVDYDQLIAPLIEAVKELKAENDDLRARIQKLEEVK